MLAIGGLLVCAALLTLAAVAPTFRSEQPPRWTTYGWVGELVTLAIVFALAIGIASMCAGIVDAYRTGADYLDLALLLGVLVVAVMVRRWWKARARPLALAADAGLRVVASDAGDAPSDRLAAPAERATLSPGEAPPPHRAA